MTLTLRADLALARTTYGTVVLDERTGSYWTLNPTGALVLDSLRRGDGPEAAIRRITDAYGRPEADVRQDVTALVDRLRSLGLVQVVT